MGRKKKSKTTARGLKIPPGMALALPACYNCVSEEGMFKCGRCRMVHYCGKRCQRADWASHKIFCLPYDQQVWCTLQPAKTLQMAFTRPDPGPYFKLSPAGHTYTGHEYDARVPDMFMLQDNPVCEWSAHTPECIQQYQDAKWARADTWGNDPIFLKLSHVCIQDRSAKSHRNVVAWGRSSWIRMKDYHRALVRPRTQIFNAVKAFYIIARIRQGIPRDVVNLILEWVINSWSPFVNFTTTPIPYICDPDISFTNEPRPPIDRYDLERHLVD